MLFTLKDALHFSTTHTLATNECTFPKSTPTEFTYAVNLVEVYYVYSHAYTMYYGNNAYPAVSEV